MLADRSQAFPDGAVRIGADNRGRPARADVDGFGPGFPGGILPANPARLGGPQHPGARVGGLRDMGEHVCPGPARQRRSAVQLVSQRLGGAQKPGRALGQRALPRRIHRAQFLKGIRGKDRE